LVKFVLHARNIQAYEVERKNYSLIGLLFTTSY
jgi:hypothetical protein